jgi:ornithine--oxo-acid transaminase
MEALSVMEDENFIENSERVGKVVRERLHAMVGNVIESARGKGLMNAVDINTGKMIKLC